MLDQAAVPCYCRTFTIERMPTFFKQRDNLWFPAWAFVLPSTIVRVPLSVVESLLWVIFTYFEVGLTLDAGRWLPPPAASHSRAVLHLRCGTRSDKDFGLQSALPATSPIGDQTNS